MDPVTKRRRHGRRDKAQLDPKTSGSEKDLDVDKVRKVHHVERDNIPGLYIRRGCTSATVSWTSIYQNKI